MFRTKPIYHTETPFTLFNRTKAGLSKLFIRDSFELS